MNIKQQRTQSLLQEVLSQALAQLSNPLLNSLTITSVKCSRGKQSAEVFIEATGIGQNERKAILSQLNKAQGILREYVLSSTQWFKSPSFIFKFDDSLSHARSLDCIFAQIAKDTQKSNDEQ